MKNFVLRLAAGAIGLLIASQASAQGSRTPDQLIDQLASIDCHGPGLYPYFPFPDFWAVEPDPNQNMHRAGPTPDCVPDAMRSLVRLGPRALPALVRHITDTRPTGLGIGVKLDPHKVFLGGQVFGEEYDSRAHVYDERGWPSVFLDCVNACFGNREFLDPYTIRVGDVCFTLIGQIVNRYMVAARYQMTGWVVVNSPIETPLLARKVRSDWMGLDAEGLRDSLLADLRTPLRKPPPGYASPFNGGTYAQRESSSLSRLYAGALRRLRFYYPKTYASLSGRDLVKRKAFERGEGDNL